MTTIAQRVSDEDALEMLRLHRHVPKGERKTQKELAEMYGVHPQTVSRAIKRAEEIYDAFERGIESGAIKRPVAVQKASPVVAKEETSVMLPQQFVEVLSDMDQMQSACRATGAFVATAAHTAVEGWTNEELPHEERFKMVITGTSAVIGTLFEMYDGMRRIQQLTKNTGKPPMRNAEQYYDVDGHD